MRFNYKRKPRNFGFFNVIAREFHGTENRGSVILTLSCGHKVREGASTGFIVEKKECLLCRKAVKKEGMVA